MQRVVYWGFTLLVSLLTILIAIDAPYSLRKSRSFTVDFNPSANPKLSSYSFSVNDVKGHFVINERKALTPVPSWTRESLAQLGITDYLPNPPIDARYWVFPIDGSYSYPEGVPGVRNLYGFYLARWRSTATCGVLLRQTRIGIPHWFVITVLATLTWFAWAPMRKSWRTRRRRRQGRCLQCGYDLKGTPDRCPECGLHNDPNVTPVTGSLIVS